MGTHLITLSTVGRIASGVGVDVNASAISQAKLAAALTPNSNLEFSVINDVDQIPNGEFDVVMMIDLMHHVPVEIRKKMFAACAVRTKTGGVLIYKDMADAPLLYATANRLHDLIIAKELIHYLPLETVIDWGNEAQLSLFERAEYKRLVYAHEMVVFKKN